MLRILCTALLAAALPVACGSPDQVAGQGQEAEHPVTPPPPQPPPSRVASLEVFLDPVHAFPRMQGGLQIRARDSFGRDEDAAAVEFSVSDPSIAAVSGKHWTWALR